MRTSTGRLIILLGWLYAAHASAMTLPSFQQVRAQHPSAYATLLDRNGSVLQMLQLNKNVQRLPWVALDDLSPAMQNALLASEDQRFFQHHGVDWQAFVGAAWENLRYDTHRGASTLTMQLAGLLDPSLTRSAGGRTFTQKWRQIKAASLLEKHWSKTQILEAYLNLVNFRADLIGINAAAEALFNTAPAALDKAQAAILAALLRGPNAKPATVAERACGVAQQLQPPQPNCTVITALANQHLSSQPKLFPAPALAPEVARQYLHIPEQQLTTSLNIDIQRLALNRLTQQLQKTTDSNIGAILVLANDTAEILAYAEVKPNNVTAADLITVPQPTDALTQPFLYELAIAQQQLTAATILNNSPLPIVNANLYPGYINDATTPAWVSVRYALAKTLQVPAWYTLQLVTPGIFSNQLQTLGFSVADPNLPDHNIASMLTLANAYQSIANHGLWRAASFHSGGADQSRRTMPAAGAAIISNILADPNAHGDAQLKIMRGYAAYEQSQDESQQWCAGSTATATIVVWLGNSKHTSLPDSNNQAASIWADVVNGLNDQLYPGHAPKPPDGVIVSNIIFIPPIEPPRKEWFMPGTEQSRFVLPGDTNEITDPALNFAP